MILPSTSPTLYSGHVEVRTYVCKYLCTYTLTYPPLQCVWVSDSSLRSRQLGRPRLWMRGGWTPTPLSSSYRDGCPARHSVPASQGIPRDEWSYVHMYVQTSVQQHHKNVRTIKTVYARARARARAHTHTHTYTNTHTYTHDCKTHACTHVRMYVRKHARTYTCMHTHTYIREQTLAAL